MASLREVIETAGKVEVARPVTLGVTLWLTYHSYQWAATFAEESTRTGVEVAMVIAAVIAPISLLQGYVFKAYIGNGER